MITILIGASPHCQKFGPVFEQAAAEMRKHKSTSMIPFARVDVTKNDKLTNRYNIKGIPVMHMFQ